MVILDKFPRNKLCVDLIGSTASKKDRHNFNMLLNPFSIKPPAQKFYTTHNKAKTIANIVYIFCTTDYNHS